MKKFESYYAVSFLLLYLSFYNKDPILFPYIKINLNFLIALSSLPILFLLSKSNSDILEHFFVITSFFTAIRSFSSPKISYFNNERPFNLSQFSHPIAIASIILLFYYKLIDSSHIYISYFLLSIFSFLHIFSKISSIDFILQDYVLIHLLFFYSKY